MRKPKTLVDLILNLFEGEAAATASGEGSGETTTTGETRRAAAGRSGRRVNPLADVQYGKQVESESQQVDTAQGAEEAPDRASTFKNMISGEYKQEFQDEFQRIFNERFKAERGRTEQLESAVRDMLGVTDMVSKKYGVDPDDMDGIRQALEADKSFWQSAAIEQGLSVDQYKEKLKLEEENRQLKRDHDERQKREAADKQYAAWEQEAEEVREFYPGFDLQAEAQNEKFIGMLKQGFGMKEAYQALHFDDLMQEMGAQTATAVRDKLSNAAQSRFNRPPENGTTGRASAIIKQDPKKWSRADRDEVIRRSMSGERIVL